MAIINSDSADYYTNILQRYAAGNAIIDAVAARTGVAGIVTTYATTYFLDNLTSYDIPVERDTIFRTFAFRPTALPPSGLVTLVQFMQIDYTPLVCLAMDDLGYLVALSGTQAGTVLETSSDMLTVGVYYYLEVKVFTNVAIGTVEVRVWPDGNGSTTYINFTGNTGSGLIGSVGHGTDGPVPTDAIAPDAYWDDLLTYDTTGTTNNDWLGNRKITAKANQGIGGSFSQWAPSPPPANAPNVDEIPPDEGTTFNFAPSDYTAGIQIISSYDGVNTIYDEPSDPHVMHTEYLSAAEGDFLIYFFETFWEDALQPAEPMITGAPAGWTLLIDVLATNGSNHSKLTVYYKFLEAADVPLPTFDWEYTGETDNFEARPLARGVLLRNVNVATPFESTVSATTIDDFETTSIGAMTITPADGGIFLGGTRGRLLIGGVQQDIGEPTSSVPSDFINLQDIYAVRYWYRKSCAPDNLAGLTWTWTKTVPPVDLTVVPVASVGMSILASEPCAVLAEGQDTFPFEAVTETEEVNAVVVNLCTTFEDAADHTVGAVTLTSGISDLGYGVTPAATYSIKQFPRETAADGDIWGTGARVNSSEFGYSLDPPDPPIPPEDEPIFLADAETITGFANNDPMSPSWVETGVHAYTMTPAAPIAGDVAIQLYSTGGQFPDATQASIIGLTETGGPCVTNAGFVNISTNADLFLGSAFTILCVIKLTALRGCSQTGGPALMYRIGSGFDATGWQLWVHNDNDVVGTVEFNRYDSAGSPILNLFSLGGDIALNTAYLITVTCDGSTVRMQIDGTETDNEVYITGADPGAANFNFLNLHDGQNAPQGNTPLTKVWNRDLTGSELDAEEAAAALRYGITL